MKRIAGFSPATPVPPRNPAMFTVGRMPGQPTPTMLAVAGRLLDVIEDAVDNGEISVADSVEVTANLFAIVRNTVSR